MGTVVKLLEQWESKELIMTGNCLQYDGLVTLVHAIVNKNYSMILQRVDAQRNSAQFSREQISQLCELVVFNNNCNIRYANLEGFLIIDGNDLDNISDITDVRSVCFTGNINASKKGTCLVHLKDLLSCRKSSLDDLYILMSGELSLDKSFFSVLK